MTTHHGGCHCGRVRFEVDAPAHVEVTRCNCSICTKTGFLHLIVSNNDFRLTGGEDDLETYTFGTGTAKHLFCRRCGVKSFYVPRSHSDGVSVKVNCLDEGTIASMEIMDFDGQNWEQNIAKLSPLSD